MVYKAIFVRAMRIYFAPLAGAIAGAIEASKAEINRTHKSGK